jgi:hypothetical protein
MNNILHRSKWWITATTVSAAIAAIFWFGYLKERTGDSREQMLRLLPTDSKAILYADLQQLRSSGFLKEISSWAPRPPADGDYAEFLRSTGFDYESDLNRLAIAVEKTDSAPLLFAVAEGHFDRAKISAYATKSGSSEKLGGREIFSIPSNNGARQIKFTFLRNDEIALTNGPSLASYLASTEKNPDAQDWQMRFDRLAGSPVFVVIRQDTGTAQELSRQAPGGWRSPQLSAVFEQLQWLSVAAKPDSSGLRVVTEAECASEKVTRQLSDLLTGIVVLAEGGLNDAKTRQQMDPQARQAYLELLKSAEVTRIDRGPTKSVRVVLSVTPKFLAIAHVPAPEPVPGKKTSIGHL